MFENLLLLGAGLLCLAVLALILSKAFIRRSKLPAANVKPAASQPQITGDDAHTYDPKDGLMIVTGTQNPAVKLPSTLSSTDRTVVDEYLNLGKDLGLAISYFPHGASVKESFIDAFIAAEQRYIALGFRTISLHAFEGLGGWNKPLPADEQACVLRANGEEPKLVGEPTKARLKELGRLY